MVRRSEDVWNKREKNGSHVEEDPTRADALKSTIAERASPECSDTAASSGHSLVDGIENVPSTDAVKQVGETNKGKV